jgi:hypothetical protein
MLLERAWYEGSPYLYAATGVVSALNAGSFLMHCSAALLVCAALTIIAFRWMHRRDTLQAQVRLDESRYVPNITQDVFAARERRA